MDKQSIDIFLDLVYPDIKPIYLISSSGIVINKYTGKRISSHLNEKGYVKVALMTIHGRNKSIRLHRLVAMMFIPNENNREQVNHIDGVKTNNSFCNLEWVSALENQLHAYRTGLKHPKRGELNGRNVYPEEMIDEIVQAIKMGYDNSMIRLILDSKYPGINYSNYLIYDIRRGKIWRQVIELYK